MPLRDYQQRAIDDLYAWFDSGNTGNPCLVMPTGSGKSHVIAAFCQDVLRRWPYVRILMLTHVKELIKQNANKMLQYWPNAPLGIYSAGLSKREIGNRITFAGIQSVRKKTDLLGHIDIIIVDESHLISHKKQGGYRDLVAALRAENPNVCVIGLTASPYRLGHGYISDGEGIFDELLEPVTIFELIDRGFLAPLHSKITDERFDTSKVKKRGGEFIEKDLQAAVNTDAHNAHVVDETIALAGDRKAWLIFCAGVDHSYAIADALNARGIPTATVVGSTPETERDAILQDYMAGKYRALTNANVLTTGFDYPDIDLIAMLRPTMSPGLYLQMAGRGMRPKSHTDHCLVLDFAGNVAKHGPITAINPPGSKGDGGGEAPVKLCDNCNELVHISLRACPVCGFEFPDPVKEKLKLHDDDIMGLDKTIEMDITSWHWLVHKSYTSGKMMLKVRYYGGLSDKSIEEYYTILHDGYAGRKSRKNLTKLAMNAGVELDWTDENIDLRKMADVLESGRCPIKIKYEKDGKFYRVINREWSEENESNL